MPGIENITDKIIEDAKTKAALEIAGAKQKATETAKAAAEEANREKGRILEEAKALAARRKEQIAAKTAAEIRDRKLEAKQKAIDGVFAESLARLEALGPDEFESFAAGFCKNAKIKQGDFIVLPEKYKGIDIKNIDPTLSLCPEKRRISGGFILVSGGLEQNHTFSALLDYLRNDIEPEVISKLF